MYPQAIDVSKWQDPHTINYLEFNSDGGDAVIIRSSYGESLQDEQAKHHLRLATEAGLITGHYHFLTMADPQKQFDNFMSSLRGLSYGQPGQLFPVLDLEKEADFDGERYADHAAYMIEKLLIEYDRLIIYMSAHFPGELPHRDFLSDERLDFWLAHYGREPGKPSYKWIEESRVFLHQQSDSEHLAGVTAFAIDKNYTTPGFKWWDAYQIRAASVDAGESGETQKDEAGEKTAAILYEIKELFEQLAELWRNKHDS